MGNNSASGRLRGQSIRTLMWSVVGLACSLVAGVMTARLLGPSDRGILSVLLTLIGIGTLVGALGTNVALRVYLPKDPRVTIGGFLRLSRRMTLFVALVLTPLAVAVEVHLGQSILDPAMVALVAVLIVATFMSNQVLDIFNAIHQTSKSAKINTAGFIVVTLALGIAWLSGVGLHWVLACYAAGSLVRVLVGRATLGTEVVMVENDHTAARLIRGGLPLLGTNLGQALMLRADQLLVGLFLGSHAAGLYAVAATPAGILTVVANSVGQSTFAEAAHGRLTLRSLSRQVALATGITLGLAVVGLLVMPLALPLLFGAEFEEGVNIARLLLLAQVALAPYLVLSRAGAGYGLVRLAGLTGFGGVALLVLSMSLLLPVLGVVGAAIGCICSFMVMDLVLAVGLSAMKPWSREVDAGSDLS